MADNFTTNAGSGGDTFAADDISGVKYPRTKLIVGADGTNDGDVSSANPLPVGGTVTANLGAVDNAVLDSIAADTSTLAGAVAGSEMQVDVISMPTVTVTGTVGVSGAVEIANDAGNPIPVNGTVTANLGSIGDVATQTTLAAINAKITACNTAGVVVSSSALPSGAATEATLGTLSGKVTACNTGAVTVSSSALPTGAATEATLGTLNGKVTACNTGAVAGTVTANAGTNLNTSALALESGGNVAAAATSLAVVDDWDSADDCRAISQSAAAMDGATRCDVKRFRVKCTNGANTLIAAVVGKKFRLRSLAFLATSGTAVTVYLSTTTDTGVLGDSTDKLTFDLDGGGGPAGLVLPHNPDGWLQTSTANEALTATLSAAEEVWILGTYIEVA
mgnify:CR=1 FL=1